MKKVWETLVVAASFAGAAVNLDVNLGDSIRPVTHVATGSLYGLTESLPSDIEKDGAPLKPNVMALPISKYGALEATSLIRDSG